MVLLIALPLPARADQTNQYGNYVSYPSPCIYAWSELTRQDTTTARGPSGLYPDSFGWVFYSCVRFPIVPATVPKNYLVIYLSLNYMRPGSTTPTTCRTAGPFYNSIAPAYSLEVSGPYWGSEPCGAGNYQLNTYVYAAIPPTPSYQTSGGSVSSGSYLWD
jgi:hypothetical protein